MSSDGTTSPDGRLHRGLTGVIFEETGLTGIRAERAELRHRGYAIEDLAADPSFERTAYLLLHGEWPTTAQHLAFHVELAARRSLPKSAVRMLRLLREYRPDDALRIAVSSLDLGQHDGRAAMDIGLDLIAKIPSMIVGLHAIRSGRQPPATDPTLDHATDFLRRLLDRTPSALEQAMINLDFVLHADHGADHPSFAARVVASTGAGMAYAIMAAMAAVAGPLDGGAILEAEAALAELETQGSKARRSLPGQTAASAIYPRCDPRCRLYRRALIALAREAGDDQAVALVAALSDAIAPSQRMGVDVATALHAAALHRLLGLPRQLSISTFMAARSVGWVAQVLEQRKSSAPILPQLRYSGPAPRDLPGKSGR